MSYVHSLDYASNRHIVENVLRSDRTVDSIVDAKLAHLLFRNYRVQLLGKDYIGGKNMLVAVLKSRFRSQPCRQLWIDENSGRVVAFKDWGRGGVLKFMGVYEKRRDRIFVHESDVARQISMEPDDFHLREALLRDLRPGGPVWRVSSLPLGFEYLGSRVVRGGWWQDVYSDGIFAVSVFSRFACDEAEKPDRGSISIVRVPGIGLAMCGSIGVNNFIFVGDISASEIRLMVSGGM
ncbi:MAG: hypothetical protein ACUVRS_08820 [Armatimonadota bacterium]